MPTTIAVETDLLSDLDEVRHQGDRPACLAFASTAAHELARIVRRGGREDLSEEHLFWVATEKGANSANGIQFPDVAAALNLPGQAVAEVAAYDPSRRPGGYDLESDVNERANLRRAKFSQIETDAAGIERAINRKQIVVAGLGLWPEFFVPKQGLIDDPPTGFPRVGLHAVALVGYSIAGQKFLLRNSWGQTWGDEGYALVSYDAIEIAIKEAWVAEDSLDDYP